MEVVIIMIVLIWAGFNAEAAKAKKQPVKAERKPSEPVVRAKGEIFYSDGKKYFNDWTRGIIEIK